MVQWMVTSLLYFPSAAHNHFSCPLHPQSNESVLRGGVERVVLVIFGCVAGKEKWSCLLRSIPTIREKNRIHDLGLANSFLANLTKSKFTQGRSAIYPVCGWALWAHGTGDSPSTPCGSSKKYGRGSLLLMTMLLTLERKQNRGAHKKKAPGLLVG